VSEKPKSAEVQEDEGSPRAPEETGSYSMVDPRFREHYFRF